MCDCNVDDSEHNVCEYNDDEKNLSDLKMNNCNDEYQEYILGNNEQLDDKLRVLVNDIQNGKYEPDLNLVPKSRTARSQIYHGPCHSM